jgi:enoyl-[acyl-carrier-protein] reductase (NADH)
MADEFARSLSGLKALVIGLANDRSIAYGCARAFRQQGAELAITYLNDNARPFVEPLARELESTRNSILLNAARATWLCAGVGKGAVCRTVSRWMLSPSGVSF